VTTAGEKAEQVRTMLRRIPEAMREVTVDELLRRVSRDIARLE
jgi:hypothetical protein